MSYDIFTLPDGTEVGTGNRPDPHGRPKTMYTPLADSDVKMLTRDEIGKIIGRASYTPRRQRYGAKTVVHQKNIGSCNGWAAAMAMARALEVLGHGFRMLSGSFIYANINGGVDRGSMLDDGMAFIKQTGVCPYEMVPVTQWHKSRIPAEAYTEADRFRALECHRIDTDDELASAVAQGFMAVIAVHANNNFMRLDGDGNVYSTDGPGNHACLLDDIRISDRGEYQYELVNSWGTSWGDEGHGWVSWDKHFRTPSTRHAFYCIRAVHDDPQGTNPPEIVT